MILLSNIYRVETAHWFAPPYPYNAPEAHKSQAGAPDKGKLAEHWLFVFHIYPLKQPRPGSIFFEDFFDSELIFKKYA